MAERHDQHHSGDHISDRKLFQLHHPEARCDQEHAATGFEIADHRLSAERVDRSGKQEKRHEDDKLRNRDCAGTENQIQIRLKEFGQPRPIKEPTIPPEITPRQFAIIPIGMKDSLFSYKKISFLFRTFFNLLCRHCTYKLDSCQRFSLRS